MSFRVAEKGIILDSSGNPAWLKAIENNWYEGSRWSPNRSFIWFPVQDPKRDLDRFTRIELSRRGRYLYKNSPFIRGLIERMVTLIVGTGFHPIPHSSNPEWNKRAKIWWKKKRRNIHLGARCNAMQYQRCVQRAAFIDGEAFTVKTADETVEYTLKVQGLESERIAGLQKKGKGASSYNEANAEFLYSSNYNKTAGGVDGFVLNEQGIVIGYNIAGVATYGAENIVQHMTPNRLGQYRGESILASAINTAVDIDDILALEKSAVKDASSKRDVIQTETGQLDPETFRTLRYGQQYPTVFNLPQDNDTKDDYYRIHFGSEPVVMKRGDKYTPYKPDRPGSAWVGFMEFLSNTICLSTGFPPSTILPINIGGTDIRRDLDIAEKVAEPYRMDRVMELDEILQYLLLQEVTDGDLRKDLPDDWNNWTWQMPQRVNVDRSTAQQDREDVMHGLMSLEEYHGRWGENADEVESTVILEVKKRKAAIQAAGFKDTKEFVEVMSLDSKMFMTRSQEDDALATGQPEPTPAPPGNPRQRNQNQN